jgi:hypothetical protein
MFLLKFFADLQVKIQVARGWERQGLCRLTSEANLHMLTVVTGTPLQQVQIMQATKPILRVICVCTGYRT